MNKSVIFCVVCSTMCLKCLIELKELETNYNAITIAREELVASYHKIRQQLEGLNRELAAYFQKPQYLLPFLQPGRLVKVFYSSHLLRIT